MSVIYINSSIVYVNLLKYEYVVKGNNTMQLHANQSLWFNRK